jgi:molecular chaperone GrpE
MNRKKSDGADKKKAGEKHRKRDTREPESAEIDKLQAKVDELTSLLQRERADSDNIRRQNEARVANLKVSVKVDLIKELISFVDDFDRAVAHTPKELAENDYVKGVHSVAKRLDSALAKIGANRINTKQAEFDPEIHDAVTYDENGEGNKEVVIEELVSGWMVDGVVVRPAKVRVGKS